MVGRRPKSVVTCMRMQNMKILFHCTNIQRHQITNGCLTLHELSSVMESNHFELRLKAKISLRL